MDCQPLRTMAGIGLLLLTMVAGQCPAQHPAAVADPARPAADDYDGLRVGPAGSRRIAVPTNQILSPQGRQVVLDARPTDLALSPDGRWLAVLGNNAVYLIDPAAGKVVCRVPHAAGSFTGIVFSADGKRLLASSLFGAIGSFAVEASGELEAQPPIALPARSTPLPEPPGPVDATAKKLRRSARAGRAGAGSRRPDLVGRLEHRQRPGRDRSGRRPSAADDSRGQRAVWRGVARRQGLCEQLGRPRARAAGPGRPLRHRPAGPRGPAAEHRQRRVGLGRRSGRRARDPADPRGLASVRRWRRRPTAATFWWPTPTATAFR